MTEKLPSGIKHLHGNKYLVRLSCIQTAGGGFDLNAKTLEFRNPRWRMDGSNTGCGFSPQEMAELRSSIQDNGLDHNLTLRWFPYQEAPHRGSPGGVQLVDGERRFRSISKLVAEDAQCFDPESYELVVASKLYEFVECKITWMTDEEALSRAITNNETAIDIGPGAPVGLVRYLRQVGKTDEEILTILRKSPDWLLKTDKLFEQLDEQTLQALVEDKIGRNVAITLSKVPLPERATKLQLAMDATTERLANLEAKQNDAELDDVVAEAEVEVEQERGSSEDIIAAAKEKADKAKKRVKRAQAAAARPRANITSGKDMEAAGHVAPKPLTGAKITKHIYDPVCNIIKAKGLDENGQSMNIDLEDARLIKCFCDLLKEGSDNHDTMLLHFLQQHKKFKDKRAAVPVK